MSAWKPSILVAVLATTLVFGLGALSALALTRGSKAGPDCGTPTTDSIPCIISGHHDADVALSGPTRIGGMRIRPGDWLFIAKVDLQSTLSSPHSVPCTLSIGAVSDVAEGVLPPGQSTTATMEVVGSLTTNQVALVSCDGISGETASSLKIIAIRAGLLFDQAIS